MRALPAFAHSPCSAGQSRWKGLIYICGTLLCTGAQAFSVSITPGTRSLFLQVGAGTMTGGNFNSGGTPGNNATINSVSVTVPAASLGAGSLAMNTDSTVTASPYNGRTFCTIPTQVYIGGFYRAPGTEQRAILSAAAPVSLTNASGNTIPFNRVSWVSAGTADSAPTIADGTFVGGASQTLRRIARNTWFESCLQFSYANTQLVGSGEFKGTVIYTLTAP